MTSGTRTTLRRIGLALHAPVIGMMLFGGSGKAFGFAPPDVVKNLVSHGLAGRMTLIGAGELVSVLLLLFPRTLSLGLLMTSAFWGGAICLHMSHGESFAFQSALLATTWAGAFLRDPRTLGGLLGPDRAGALKAAPVDGPEPLR